MSVELYTLAGTEPLQLTQPNHDLVPTWGNTPIASYESLYVVTKEQGRWAIKMRSSFVP